MKSNKGTLARILCFAASACILAYAVLSYRTERAFQNPIAYAFAHQKLYVLEKERNTLLELSTAPSKRVMEALGAHEIEPDDADHYYMARKLYSSKEGLVVQSYIYALQTREFLGYRFSLYSSFRTPPKPLLTIILKNPQDFPEISYSSDAQGNHYFASNIRYQFNLWKLAPGHEVRIDFGQIPESVRVMGERNGPLDKWETMTVGPDGSIYVSSEATGRVVKYSPEGENVGEIGSVGFEKGSLLAPGDVFFAQASPDEAPLLTVASDGNRTWVQYDETGSVRRVLAPLEQGYPFADVLVGRFYYDPATNRLCAFDLANKSFTTLSRKFEGIGAYSLAQPGRAMALLAVSSALLLMGVAIPHLTRHFAHTRIPFFFKLLVPFVCLLMLTGKLVGTGVQKIMSEEIMQESVRRSANLAGAVLNSLSPADLKSIQNPQDRESPVYERVYQDISRVLNREEVDQTPKWILHKIRDGRYYFGINIWRGAIYAPYVIPQDRTALYRVIQERIPQYGFFVDEQGEWFSYLAPVVDETGTVINVLDLYRPAEELRRAHQQVSRKVNEVVSFTVAATFVLLLLYSLIFTRPLRRLKRHTEIIRSGDFDHPIDIRSRDELGDLARAFNTMVEDLKSYTREIARTAAEKEALAGELRLARQLQQEMLPQALPLQARTAHLSMFAEMQPAREVGGDYYDYFAVDENHLGVLVADVSGKGIPAALFMMRMRSMLRGSAAGNLSPADTLSRINQLIAPENASAMFVTIFYFIFHLETGRITYCNAGHNAPLLLSHRNAVPLGEESPTGKGFPIGVMEEAQYTDGHLQLHGGETLLLYSDGVTESTSPDGRLFTEERLAALLSTLTDLGPKDLCTGILNQVKAHQGSASQADDITLLAFRLDMPLPCRDPAGMEQSRSAGE